MMCLPSTMQHGKNLFKPSVQDKFLVEFPVNTFLQFNNNFAIHLELLETFAFVKIDPY